MFKSLGSFFRGIFESEQEPKEYIAKISKENQKGLYETLALQKKYEEEKKRQAILAEKRAKKEAERKAKEDAKKAKLEMKLAAKKAKEDAKAKAKEAKLSQKKKAA